MSRREDDEGNNTASGADATPETSPEDEFRDWVGETAAGPDPGEGDVAPGGWLSRVFGRGEPADEPAAAPESEVEPPGYDPRLSSSPDELAIFSAVSDPNEGEPPQGSGPTSVPAGGEKPGPPTEEEATTEPVPAEEDEEEPATEPPAVESESASVVEFPAGKEESQQSFADLWGASEAEEEDEAEEVVDFATFTSEDYLQATTREYAGLAEEVARAEEEETQRIAVSAEIPGLESGLVGLDDVVSAAGGAEPSDMIAPPTASELSIRVLTALGLLLLFAASLLSPYGIGVLIIVVLGVAAGELFHALIGAGYRPLSIFGFVGIGGAFLGTWASGPVAIPIALLLTAIAVFLFYATAPGRSAVLENATVTLLVTAWIGGLGGLAFDLLGSPHYRWLIVALVVTVAVMDVAQYFIGRRFGRRQLAPVVSPKKTIEGYIAGVIVAIGVGAAFSWAEPFDLTDGLIIGAIAAVVGPLGDLAVSVIKRTLGVKDMGHMLPGHGGVLDRVDAMIMTIPALWMAYSWMGLVS